MAYETLQTQLDAGVFTLTLHRPDRMNAFSHQMFEDLLDVFDEIDRNDDIRAVIVTGSGRAFCAGADLGKRDSSKSGGAFDRTERSDAHAHRDEGGVLTLRIYECLKPVIAAVNGAAVGVGVTMTLPMDVRIASERAKFGFVFARRGIVPEACSSWFLPRVVGIGRAMEWVATGRIFEAPEALEGGLVNRVVPPEELLPAANAIAREIVENTSAISVALSRQMLWKMLGADHPMEAHQVDSAAIYAQGRSPDGYEGVKSFLEKRPAEFPMKVSKDMPAFFPWWKERKFEGLE
jgi:enoyl-CoA hydratase/carnithine racemase